MHAWTWLYFSQSLWLVAFTALLEIGCSGKDTKTQCPEPEYVEYGALCSFMRAASPGESLDFDESRAVKSSKPLKLKRVATLEATAHDVQKHAESATKPY